jgi:hypothetical protein
MAVMANPVSQKVKNIRKLVCISLFYFHHIEEPVHFTLTSNFSLTCFSPSPADKLVAIIGQVKEWA